MKKIKLNEWWTSDHRNLAIILLFNGLVRFIYLNASMPYKIFGDTPTYVDFPFNDFLHLKFTSGRTPVYPIILQVVEWFTSDDFFYQGVVWFQVSISMISVIFFYKALKYLIDYDIISVSLTVLYSCSLAVIGWDNAILTESLALSGCVVFIYLLFRYLNHATTKLAIWIPIFTLILTFLRPTFLYFSVILLIFYVVRLFQKENIRCDIKGIISSLGCLSVVVGYSYIFSLEHDIFSISDAKVRQDLIVSITQGYYHDASNEEFVQYIDEKMEETNHDVWQVVFPTIETFGNRDVAQFVKEARNEHSVDYLLYLKQLVLEHYNIPYDAYNIYNHDFQKRVDLNTIVTSPFLFLKFHHVYWIAIIEFIIVMWIIFKEKRIDLIHSGFFVFTAGILVSTFIGTCGEYMRTSLMVVPFSYIIFAYYLNYFIHRSIRKIPSVSTSF